MATQLDVVNACLAIMGEAPLNSLIEQHAYKAAALKYFNDNNDAIQGKGWWYNTETLTLTPNPIDNRVYLPGDGAKWESQKSPQYVQRGRVLYDLYNGTDLFPVGFSLKGKIIRQIPYPDVPLSISMYIQQKTVLDFQNRYDGDQTKTRNLQIEVFGNSAADVLGLRGEAMSEHIRNIDMNFINENQRLGRIRNVIRHVRR